MPVGGDGANDRHFVGFGRMEIDAVQIITGLLGRNRESGAVDQGAEFGRRQREVVRQLAARHQRIVLRREAGEGESRAAGAQHYRVALAARLDFDLRALAQLADDVIEGVGRCAGPALAFDLSGDALDDLEIHIGRAQRQPARFGAQQHVR